MKKLLVIPIVIFSILLILPNQAWAANDEKIIFLHHSTGSNIWDGGVASWFSDYNSANGTSYQITEQSFPEDSPYGWENYPYDYWNIWVNHAGSSYYLDEPTLEILTQTYDVIIWKHCFPVSSIEADAGSPDITSSDKTQENYRLQYNALKTKMREFPNTKFIVWTGAALVQGETSSAEATRAKDFFNWVKNNWDETGDNIFIWDFWQLETKGGLYLLNAYTEDEYDSHPNNFLSQTVAPYFSQRITNIITGNGDTTSLTGQEPENNEEEEEEEENDIPDDILEDIIEEDPTDSNQTCQAANPLGIILTTASAGSPNLRIVDHIGNQISSFFPYSQSLRGEWRSIQADIDGDGTNELVTYTAPGFGSQIRAFEADGTFLDDFMAYDANFRGGLVMTAGDFDGDCKDEIALAPESLGGPNIRIYDFNNRKFSLKNWFMAYDEGFHGGVKLASGDIDGDDNAEIIITPLSHGGPNVRAYYWDGNSFEVLDWVMAYDENFHGGVQLTTGDIDGDDADDIIVIPLVDGGPNVRVYHWNNNQLELMDWVMAYDENYRGTLNVTTGDVNGDGMSEIILVPRTLGGPNVRIYQYTNGNLSLLDWFMAYDQNFNNGVNITALDIDNDNKAEIITAPYRGNPNVRVYNISNSGESLYSWFWGFPQSFTGGINFAK